MAYFRICMVLFKMMSKDLRKTNSMSEFLGYIDNYICNFNDTDKFKERLKNFYISEKLINYVRNNIINKETTKYHKNMRQRFETEKCMESSPYCFLTKNTLFANDLHFILRSENIMVNLHSNHFDINKSNIYHKINYYQNSVDDNCLNSNYRFSKRTFSRPETYKNQNMMTLYENKNNQKYGNGILKDIESYKSSKNPETYLLYTSKASPLDIIEKDLLIVRMNHLCFLKDLSLEKKKGLRKRKKIFFQKTLKILEKYFGPKIIAHITKDDYTNKTKAKMSTELLVKNHELRNSLNSYNKSSQLVLKRRSNSEEILNNLGCNIKGIMPRTTITMKLGSFDINLDDNNEIDHANSFNSDDVDSIEDIEQKVRNSMDDVFTKIDDKKC